ncbi:hypothetical protein DIPPA_50705, partial [Diplonema papillatum]
MKRQTSQSTLQGFVTSKKPKPAPKPADEPKAVREDAEWGKLYSQDYAKWTKKDVASLGGGTKTLKEYVKVQAKARHMTRGGWQNWPTALLISTMTIFDSLVDEDNKNPPHRRQTLEQLQSSAYSSASLRLSPVFSSTLQAAALVCTALGDSHLPVFTTRPMLAPEVLGLDPGTAEDADVVNAAYEGLEGFTAIDARFIEAYHTEHAEPYLNALLSAIKNRLRIAPLLTAMSSLFDPSGPVLREGGDPDVATTHLSTILTFYGETKV